MPSPKKRVRETLCVVCEDPTDNGHMCKSCNLSYARDLRHSEETIMSVIVWAAKRARVTLRNKLRAARRENK
jgi:hypothetical protein